MAPREGRGSYAGFVGAVGEVACPEDREEFGRDLHGEGRFGHLDELLGGEAVAVGGCGGGGVRGDGQTFGFVGLGREAAAFEAGDCGARGSFLGGADKGGDVLGRSAEHAAGKEEGCGCDEGFEGEEGKVGLGVGRRHVRL